MLKAAKGKDGTRYNVLAQGFHWITFLLVAILVPTGLIMTSRGERNIWDDVTNNLYSTHKLIGFGLLWIIALRIIYRLAAGAPGPEAGLAAWQIAASRANHVALYVLLVVMPLLGWLGVSMFPALDIFDWFALPSIAGKSDRASQVLNLHKAIAWVLIALAGLHIAAALYHALVLRDGVIWRMLPRMARAAKRSG